MLSSNFTNCRDPVEQSSSFPQKSVQNPILASPDTMRSLVWPQTVDVRLPLSHALLPSKQPAVPPPPSAEGGLTQDEMKRVSAYRAVELVDSGMVVGLGTGSTAVHALDRIGELLRCGALHNVIGIPTSLKTAAYAAKVGIPLSDLDSHPVVDLSIDGADEVDACLNLIKGRGGSLLREKMIEGASKRFVVIVDESKLVPCLGGSGLAVPVEVIPFCWKFTLSQLWSLFDEEDRFEAKLRMVSGGAEEAEKPFITDNSNYIIDLYFEKGIMGELNVISDSILRLTGVVEHGMFLGMATSVIVAKKDGGVVVLNR